ncbi:MAG: carbohydrate ABC transporter permease [Candidatus Scatosoma sp.]
MTKKKNKLNGAAPKVKNPLNKNPIIIVTMAVLILYALSILLVLGWGLLTAFKSDIDFEIMGNYIGLPNSEYSREEMFRFKNFTTVFKYMGTLQYSAIFYSGSTKVSHTLGGAGETVSFFTYLWYTILYTGIGSLILAIVPAVGAYMCAKYKFKFSKIQYTVYLLFMMIPIVGTYPSELAFLRATGLYDTLWGNWIQKFHFSGMYFFVYFAFYQGLPDAYAEAAEIDGASQLNVLLRIIIPLSIKMIGSVFLIQFINLWNDYQTPLLYLPTKPTLSYVVYLFSQLNSPGLSPAVKGKHPVEIAACLMLALPILVLYCAFNKKLVGDISMGGIKG